MGGSLIDYGWLTRLLLAVFASTVLAGLAAARLPPLLAVLTGAIIYGGLLMVVAARVRLLTADDAVWVSDLFGSRLRGLPRAAARYAGGIARR